MNVLEYEAKQLLQSFHIPIPHGVVLHPGDNAPTAPIVLKSQVHTGGRGKAGGVIVIQHGDTTSPMHDIFALAIAGERPSCILAEEVIPIATEFYLSLVINRSEATIDLVASTHGGMSVEAQDIRNLFRHAIEPTTVDAVSDLLADYLAIPDKSFVLQDMVANLLACFIKNDATLLEINPLIITPPGELIAGDCKMTLDDDARFRHPEWHFERPPASTTFVTLDRNGTVATIANGAGLAMATVDAVRAAHLIPANFLDIGGNATVDGIVRCFRSIVAFPRVTAIVINIFGGIVRCDDVAKAIIQARDQFPQLPSVYIRLSGSYSQEATRLLTQRHLTLYPDIQSCLREINHES